MAVEQALLALVGAADTGAYQINQSLRFNSADSAYLNRTPAAGSNRRTFTLSFWIKKTGPLAAFNYGILGNYTDGSNSNEIYFNSQDRLLFYDNQSGTDYGYGWTLVFRDPSAWYHIAIVVDTTNATATDRLKLYVNGVRQTDVSLNYGDFPLNHQVRLLSDSYTHYIGRGYSPAEYGNYYLAEYSLIDGTALTPSSFGETDTITGAWIPKKYSGSYGTNGFYLKFESSGIGTDSSGNGNNWTANNFSTSGTGTDVMSDTPTNNWCTLNPLKLGANVTLGDGNLVATMTSTNVRWNGTIAMSPGSGKYYAEMTVTQSNGYGSIGLSSIDDPATGELSGYAGFNGNYKGSAYGSSYTTNDIIGIAYDAINGAVYFSKNGTWQNSGDPTSGSSATGAAESGLTGTYVFGGGIYGGSTGIYTLNFGQRSFSYTPPTGFKALNTANLPEPTIKKGNKYFDTVLWTGDGNNRTISGFNFSPDFVWTKSRSNAYSHKLYDAIRGAGKILGSNSTDAETTDTNTLSGFTSSGFSLGTDTGINGSGVTFVGWAWDANGAGSSNTAGTITSTVSANATAGFSIVTYTSPNNSADQTVGHGLGVKPSLIIVKNRDLTYNWDIYHSSLGYNASLIFTTATTRSGAFGAEPTSTVFTTKTGYTHNSTNKYVAYCFSEVAGYSKFGSYTGNGSSDGPFVYTGFRIAFLVVKTVDSAGEWYIEDNVRDTYNPATNALKANLADTDTNNSIYSVDYLSNGFKMRTSNTSYNWSNQKFIYMAFAELPFKYANAR